MIAVDDNSNKVCKYHNKKKSFLLVLHLLPFILARSLLFTLAKLLAWTSHLATNIIERLLVVLLHSSLLASHSKLLIFGHSLACITSSSFLRSHLTIIVIKKVEVARVTLLDLLHLVHHVLLLLLSLQLHLNLHLLPVLLQLSQLGDLLRPLLTLLLLQQLGSNLVHVIISLHHLSKVIIRSPGVDVE